MNLPTVDYRRTDLTLPPALHKGLDSVVNGLVGRHKRRSRQVKNLARKSALIDTHSQEYRHTADRILKDKLAYFHQHFRRGGQIDEDVVDNALAILVEVAERTLGMRPYPVQILGALALHHGFLAEMATGEGKSLTACLPAIMAAWTGRPCHIVTVNDYLADRDANEMRPIYAYAGVTVASVNSLMTPSERRENYASSVVYTTSKELLADFLRDRLQLGTVHHPTRRLLRLLLQPRAMASDDLVMRGLDTAIVDEADSVLIDEAVTPLIISRAHENKFLVEASRTAERIARHMLPMEDYLIDMKYREIRLTDVGLERIAANPARMPGIWQGEARRQELVEQALTAREFYLRDKQYVVEEGKVMIVDEFTGRLMHNRTWRHGLHQAVEAREGLEISNPSETLARLSFQRFFRFFKRLSGMTGTAKEASEEFWQIYGLPVITIPTHRPCIRQELPDAIFVDSASKWQAIVSSIKDLHQGGRPLLVGSRTVGASEKLAALLDSAGLEYNLLNAVRHKEEAAIVAAAGEAGRITIATNMAGRGTDIKLGRGVAKLGGLHVIAVERHESGRIDRQLFGRCARQGDPGSSQAFISLDDEILQRFAPALVRKSMIPALEKNRAVSEKIVKKTMDYAQGAAQRLAYKQRCNVLKMDTWFEEALSFSGSTLKF